MKTSSPSKVKSILAAIALVLVMVIVFFLGRASVPAPEATQTETEATETSASASEEAPEAAQNNTEPEFAESIDNPKALELLKKAPRNEDGDPRALGDINAPVVMVAYEDFSCPMCTRYFTDVHPQLKKYVDEGKLRIEFHDMVIFPNYGSDIAARASRAAANQGKFWEFVEAAYAAAGAGNHPSYNEESVVALANEIGIGDVDKFRADLNSEEIQQAVQEETAAAQIEMGVGGTPFLAFNKTVVNGAYPADFMVKTFLNQLQEVQSGK
ncbi:MAG: thioredoxin domain-containing protein [Actinomycetaceae bacterium]|nr:thioredoxin domain-containing protein [Actinomycetaceae bacterium]